MSRKKQKHEDHVNLERWLVSYADFITLLFVVFLILFAMSSVDAAKFQALAESFHSVKGSGASLVMPAPGSAMTQQAKVGATGQNKQKDEQKKLEEVKKKLEKYAKQKGIANNLNINMDKNGINVTVTGTILFANGDASLQPAAKAVIKDIFNIINTINNPVRIEGHTDDRPIQTPQYPSNWELSTARATNLIRYLVTDFKFDPTRLSVGAYGQYHPVVPNTNEENRAKNRRVEIMILSNEVKDQTPHSGEKASP
ncbi:flagellar motor protein MotB [Aneurinibacillus sp. Ricciae_BoGa-3]|uniref:flagellar motor protein MotB n=1 Tax=Aneurinibacillus sp. Ricciae_BoGa-3 TaxID=3022697 RepID=UPI002340CDE9|nr:flagellar motor protein MotB [Aneurinibacillus sp. Ricciae_BoGa-3]WCK54980.1 flagellar motor protein MotB [Aneurinibacillus sp. Ricciae_BoGa-3]